jgi:hypothetical protein
MKIDKINNNTYRVVDSSEIELLVNEMVNTLSLNSVMDFETIITDQLKDSMVSRLVAAHFTKMNPTVFNDGNMYVIIKVGFENREINVSVGNLTLENKTRTLNGVLYK